MHGRKKTDIHACDSHRHLILAFLSFPPTWSLLSLPLFFSLVSPPPPTRVSHLQQPAPPQQPGLLHPTDIFKSCQIPFHIHTYMRKRVPLDASCLHPRPHEMLLHRVCAYVCRIMHTHARTSARLCRETHPLTDNTYQWGRRPGRRPPAALQEQGQGLARSRVVLRQRLVRRCRAQPQRCL